MICSKLEKFVHIFRQQSGCTNFPCLCLWDSRACQEHWTRESWPNRERLEIGKKILYTFLWLILSRCYFLLCISKCENSLQKIWIGKTDYFAYLCEKFPVLSTEKSRAGIFYGSQIWRLNAGQIFSIYLDNPRKNAWRSLTVVENFLGYFKAPNYYDLSKQLSNSYEKLECKMSVKVHFFHSHVNYFPENLEAMIEEQGESFHQDIKTI